MNQDRSCEKGFDGVKYEKLQAEMIINRLNSLYSGVDGSTGVLYLEIGGHFLHDGHAARVLPGFDPESKPRFVHLLKEKNLETRILLCVNAKDLQKGRTFKTGQSYHECVMETLKELTEAFPENVIPKPDLAVNRLQHGEKICPKMQALLDDVNARGVAIYKRYEIPNYATNSMNLEDYLRDDHVPYCVQNVRCVLVLGLGSNCGKLATALGQIYLDKVRQQCTSAYAKYELFPIFNIPLDHPINLAYESATADIVTISSTGERIVGDVVEYDKFEDEHQNPRPVNYNRDNDAFPLLKRLLLQVSPSGSWITTAYRSPTAMGINAAGFCITDDYICAKASIRECEQRIERYKEDQLPDEIIERATDVLNRARISFRKLEEKRHK